MMGEVIRVSGDVPDVREFLKDAMLSQRFADVALCCPGGQRFLAHRLVLSAASPYLQEVLLAHSRTSTHCEPITVILAEVEAPELAAILGFVYTGTTTVPRPRLNAFVHAAETLRIRLPPVPVAMTCSQTDCAQDDIKDVKIGRKYLQCDQYPCCDRWYRGTRGNLERDDKNEPYRSLEFLENEKEIVPLPESMNYPPTRYDPMRYRSTTWPVSSLVPEKTVHAIDQRIDKVRTNRMDSGGYQTISAGSEFDRMNDVPTRIGATEHLLNSRETNEKSAQRVFRFSKSPYDPRNERLDQPETRTKSDQGYPVYEDRNEKESIVGDRLSVIRSRIDACPNKIESMQLSYGCVESYEKNNVGEDLSCHDNYCSWKSPRRHVANRVIASPWKQTVIPYHMPKLQPIVLQPHVDECDVRENSSTQELSRPTLTVTSPDLRQFAKGSNTTDNYYANEALTDQDVPFDNPVKPLEKMVAIETRTPEFYAPQVPLTSTVTNVSTIGNETTLRSQSNVIFAATRVSSSIDDSNQIDANKNIGKNCRQTIQKPEISHPVSRLCDTIESDDKTIDFANANVNEDRMEIEETIDDKLTDRIVISSDNNNNDSIVGQDSVQSVNKQQENHRCDQCGKIFVTRASLKVHVRTHSGEKPFRCADCGKQFSQLRNYKYHRSVHEGTREFAATCPECGKYFNDRGYLSSHMKIHRNRKEYGCAECGKSFNQRVAYNMHVRIHTGVKPHQCEQCGKAFSRKMLLKQHLRTHSGERPYQCQVCQKAFADRSNMTLHTRLHSGLKPYQCTLCTKAFTKKHHLKTHLNYHTGTKPYSCPNCGLRFSQSSNMRTHYKKCTINHSVESNCSSSRLENNGRDSMKTGATFRVTSTDTLTPPNSDQELTILTPISKRNSVDGSAT